MLLHSRYDRICVYIMEHRANLSSLSDPVISTVSDEAVIVQRCKCSRAVHKVGVCPFASRFARRFCYPSVKPYFARNDPTRDNPPTAKNFFLGKKAGGETTILSGLASASVVYVIPNRLRLCVGFHAPLVVLSCPAIQSERNRIAGRFEHSVISIHCARWHSLIFIDFLRKMA